jgi:hypothetical protein
MKASSGAGSEEPLLESPQVQNAYDRSGNGRFLLYQSTDPQTDVDLWVLPMSGANASPTGRSNQEMSRTLEAQARQGAAVNNASPSGRSQQEMEGDRKPWVFLKTNFQERWAQFSPDGRWVAYMSNESGRPEIYVRPFVEPAPGTTGRAAGATGGQWQVSTAGGIYPRWRPDGKELFYIGPDGLMMAAPIAATVTTLEPGAPVALFPTRIYGGGTDNQQGRQYDVSRDGRFLINTVLEDSASPITLLQNWNPPAK